MNRKKGTGYGMIKRLKNDYVYRAFIFSTVSFVITALFAAYNLFLGIAYKTLWSICIAAYYVLLLCIRVYVIFSESKFYRTKISDEQKEKKRKTLFLVQSLFLFIISIALIGPITLMVQQKKQVDYSAIPAITIAAYTTYKIIISTRNLIKSRKERHLSLKILRTVSFVDALVSILTLQYVLIITFGGMDKDMFVLSAVTSFAIWTLILWISLSCLVLSVKILKRSSDPPQSKT